MKPKKSAAQEARALFDSLMKRGGTAVKTAVSSLPRINVQRAIAPVVRAVANRPLLNYANPIGFNVSGRGPSFSPTVGQYAKGQIVQPIRQGIKQAVAPNQTLANRAMGGVGAAIGGFNATPLGMTTNVFAGIAGGLGRSIRTGQNANKSIRSAIARPTSITTAGLGITNPYLAMIGDVALTRNPKSILKDPIGLKTLSKITKSVGGSGTRSLRGSAVRLPGYTKDAVEQVMEPKNRRSIINTLVQFDEVYGSQTPRAGIPDMRKTRIATSNLAFHYKQMYGATAKLPQSVYEMREAVANGLKELSGIGRQGLSLATKTAKAKGADAPIGLGNIKKADLPQAGPVKGAMGFVGDDIDERFRATIGKPLTHSEVGRIAQVSPELSQTFGREEARSLGAQQQALRNKVEALRDAGATGDQFNEALIRDKAFGAYLSRLFGQRAARPDPDKQTIYNKIIAEVLKRGHDPEEIVVKAKGVDFDDAKQAAAFFRQFVKPNAGDWIDKLRYNSMLSSPNTQLVNVSSNLQGTGLLTPVQKTIEGGIDAVISGLTGKPRTRFTGEGVRYAAGYAGATKQAFKNMLSVFKDNQLVDNPDLHHIPLHPDDSIKGGIEAALDIPSKTLNAMDQFFATLTKGGLERSLAYRVKKGGKIAGSIEDEVGRQLFRGKLVDEGQGIISNTIGAGGQAIRNATQSKVAAFRWLAKLTIPFINIGTNLAKAGIEGNPVLGSINMIGNRDKTAQAAKLVMGGVATTAAAALALNDRLTFGEPLDPEARKRFRAAGMLPYSFKMGDRWIQYSKMHPLIAFQLGTVAALTESWKQGKISEDKAQVVMEGVWNSLRFTADQTYFKNVADFVNSVNGDVDGVSRLVANYPQQFIPYRALFGWINRQLDEVQRQPDYNADFFTKAFQQIAVQLPGLAQVMPPRLDDRGLPIPNRDRFLNAWSPAKTSTEDPFNRARFDLRETELRANAYIRPLSQEIGEQVATVGNPIINQVYEQVIAANPDLSPEIQQQIYDRLKTKVNTRVKKAILIQNAPKIGELLEKVPEESAESRVLYIQKLRAAGLLSDDVLAQLEAIEQKGTL